MYLNNSYKNEFYSEGKVVSLDTAFPYFLLRWDTLTEDAKQDFEKFVQVTPDIVKVGEEESYTSSVKFTSTTRDSVLVKNIYVKFPSLISTISDDIFNRYRNYGVEIYQFDLPYKNHVLLENCASGIPDKYLFNTNNKDEILRILSYDIETLTDGTICILGYSSFNITINSYFNITNEESRFDIIDEPEWQDIEVQQIIAKPNEEAKLLYEFVNLVKEHDIISGHNVLAFDNKEIVERINYNINNNSFNTEHLNVMYHFLKTYTEDTKIFNLGKLDDAVLIYPNSLDTLLAFQRLYFNLPSYTLKNLAKEFNINVENRIYFDSLDFGKMNKNVYDSELFKKFVIYNEHDVMEQNGLTLIALSSILAMSFITCCSLDEVVIKSNTKIGDNITITRCFYKHQIFAPTVSASKVAKELYEQFSKYYLSQNDLQNIDTENKILLKIAKYGSECPQFCYYPKLLLNCETAGGLTQKPDEDGILPSANSSMLPWVNIVNADVGAMYPSLVIAKNAVSDSVRFALLNETPTDFIWIKELDEISINESIYHMKQVSLDYQKSGIEIGIIINQELGLLSGALVGIIRLTTKIKKEISEIKKELSENNNDELKVINENKLKSVKGLYASLKAIRNAMTHGMVLAFTVNCRGSNLSSGSLIVTYANKIMFDIWSELKKLE